MIPSIHHDWGSTDESGLNMLTLLCGLKTVCDENQSTESSVV